MLRATTPNALVVTHRALKSVMIRPVALQRGSDNPKGWLFIKLIATFFGPQFHLAARDHSTFFFGFLYLGPLACTSRAPL